MPRSLKLVLGALGVLLALLVVAAVVIAATFDPNAYKPQLVELVKQKTQRTLQIPGEIELSFFPSLGARLGALSISEHRAAAPFASVESARVSLALMPLLRRVATRWLLPLALVAFAVPSLARSLMVDDRLRATLQPDHFSDLADIGAVVRYLLWTGGYPLVGWVGFALVGMWLYRELPRGRGAALRLALVSGALVATQPLWAEAREALGGGAATGQAEGLAAFFDTTAHSNMFGWYVLASASAVAAAALCLVVVPAQATRGLRPLVLLGQLALTAYVAHLVLGEQWLWEWERTERPSLLTQLVIVGLVVAAFAAVATLWRSRFQRGPLEAALRVAAG